MKHDWIQLTKLSGGNDISIERVRIKETGIAVEGEFDLPPMAKLRMEDQIFITAFIRSHGSIKEMEQLFGISYPTVKNRLNAISQQLEFVDINPPPSRTEILENLEKGTISVDEAIKKMRG